MVSPVFDAALIKRLHVRRARRFNLDLKCKKKKKITSPTNKMKPARWNLQEDLGLTFYNNRNISLLQKEAFFYQKLKLKLMNSSVSL